MELLPVLISFADISTILLCIILKVPQIISIVQSKSVKGISLPGVCLELTSYTIGMCYAAVNGYPLMSYLEYPFLVVQDVILIGIILYYSDLLSLFSLASFAAYSSVVYATLSGLVPFSVVMALMSASTPISAMSKIAQLRSIHKSQNADSVSLLTWWLAVYTTVTRIFTTVNQSIDVPLLANLSVALVLNLSVILLTVSLRRQPKQVKKE